MRVRRSWLLLGVLVMPVGATAGDHKWSAYVALTGSKISSPQSTPTSSVWNGGLSAGRGDHESGTRFGWHTAGEITVPNKFLGRPISFIGDASAHFLRSDGSTELTQLTVMLGPRLALFSRGKTHTSAHVMGFGFVQSSDTRLNVTTSRAAFAIGAGVDLIPAENGRKGIRVQLDWIVPVGTGLDSGLRYSAGFVYRYHNH